MQCPYCKYPDSKITNSRGKRKIAQYIRRKRECLKCKYRWSTVELSIVFLEKIFGKDFEKYFNKHGRPKDVDPADLVRDCAL